MVVVSITRYNFSVLVPVHDLLTGDFLAAHNMQNISNVANHHGGEAEARMPALSELMVKKVDEAAGLVAVLVPVSGRGDELNLAAKGGVLGLPMACLCSLRGYELSCVQVTSRCGPTASVDRHHGHVPVFWGVFVNEI